MFYSFYFQRTGYVSLCRMLRANGDRQLLKATQAEMAALRASHACGRA